jgi:hypothetical protein
LGAYVKKDEYTWSPIKKIYVKVNPTGSSAWKLVQRIYTKINTSGWVLFWPKIGPYATYVPSFSTDSGNVYPVTDNIAKGSDTVFYRKIGQSLYGQNAVWNANNYTISGYSWQLKGWTAYNGGTVTDTFATGTTFPKSISLSTSGFDGWTTISQWAGKFLTFSVTANTTTTGVIGSSASDDFLSGLGYTPTKLAIVQNSPSPKGGSTSGVQGIKLGDTIYYYGTWDGRELYCPDWNKSSISLYKSTTDFGSNFTLASLINGGATLVKTELAYAGLTTFSGDGTTFNTGTSYTTTTGDENCYFYFVEAQQNSADFLGNSPVYQYAKSNQVSTPPQVVVAPTITATTPSGYGGNQNSFTVGGTVTFNTGQWTPTPSGSYAVSWLGLWGTSSSLNISNGYQTNFNQMYLTLNYSTFYKEGAFDTSQNQNHSFTIPSYFYTSSNGAGGSSSAGKYISLETITKVGSGPASTAYYNTPVQIHDVPYASTVSLSSTGQNKADVTFQSTGSYYYQLQYSADGSTGWTNVGSIKYISTLNLIGYTISYTNLPSGSQYYRVLSYNDDGVTIAGTSTTFNSTPPPANVTFYYYPSDTYNSKNTYGTPTVEAAVHVTGDSTTTSIAYNIYRATSGTGIDGYGNYNSYVFYDSGTFTSNNGYAGGYYWFPENGYYFMEATPSNSNGAGNTTTSNSYGIYGVSRNWGYAGTPADPTAGSAVTATKTSLTCNWVLPTNINTDSSASITNNVHGSSASYEVWWQGVPNTTSVPGAGYTADYTGISPTSTSLIDDNHGINLGGGVTRYYFVRSRNVNGAGNWVYLGGNTTLLSDQTAPTLGTYTSTGGGFTLSITNYDSSATYTVNIGTTNSTSTPTGSVSSSTVTVSNMSSGSYCYITVTASKTGYNNATSSSTYGYAATLSAVTSLSASTTDSTKITLTWSGGSGTNYDVAYSNSSTSSALGANGSGFVDFANVGSSPYDVTSLSGASYRGSDLYSRWFWIRANAGTSHTSWYPAYNSTGIKGFMPYYPPPAPTSPLTSGVTATNITFSWTDGGHDSTHDQATSYDYYTSTSSTSPDGSTTPTGNTTSTSKSFSYTASSTPTKQYFWVRGKNLDSVGNWTSSVNATPTAQYTIAYDGNSNTGGSTTSTTGNGSVTLASNGFTRTGYSFDSWNTKSDASGVKYTAGTSYTLSADITLYAIWTLTPTLTAPTNFSAGNPSQSGIGLSWTAGTNATKYYIGMSSTTTQPAKSSFTNVGNVTSYRYTGLSAGTKYYFWIYDTDGTNDSSIVGSTNATTAAAPTLTNPKWNTTAPSNFQRITGTTPSLRYGFDNGTVSPTSGTYTTMTLDKTYLYIYTSSSGSTLYDSNGPGAFAYTTTTSGSLVNGTARNYVKVYTNSTTPAYTSSSVYGSIYISAKDYEGSVWLSTTTGRI